jgi:UbiD family decarboxylase
VPTNGGPAPDLRAFLATLRRADDVVEIQAPVDPVLEAAEIHRRVIAAGGPALVFRNVQGADYPLVTNLFGTARRAELAFGERPAQLIKRLVQLVETLMPPTPAKLWAARDVGLDLLRVGLKHGRRGPVTDVVTDDVRLDRLPAMTTWPEDGGPFVTLPLVYTQHPERRGHNLGMYRMQVYGPKQTGMHWQIGKGGGFHYAVAEARGQRLPATVFLGGPPALILSAIAPLPENIPELLLASLISGERLPQVHGHGPHPLIAMA